MGDIIVRLKKGVPQKEERWPGNDGSDLVTDFSAANKTMLEAALIIEHLVEVLMHARDQIRHPDQMIDEAIAKATGAA